jgi:hypothetical protein
MLAEKAVCSWEMEEEMAGATLMESECTRMGLCYFVVVCGLHEWGGKVRKNVEERRQVFCDTVSEMRDSDSISVDHFGNINMNFIDVISCRLYTVLLLDL